MGQNKLSGIAAKPVGRGAPAVALVAGTSWMEALTLLQNRRSQEGCGAPGDWTVLSLRR